MKGTNHTLGRVDASRCSVCRHSDREDFDRDLLRRKSQADIARLVGVDRSTVSRHVKNHVVPTLAQGVLMDTKDVAIGNIVEAFGRIHAEGWVVYERAMVSGDLRLAAPVLKEQTRGLEVVVRYAEKMGQSTIGEAMSLDPAAETATTKQYARIRLERLDDLAARNYRGIARSGSSSPDAATADEPVGETEGGVGRT